MQPGFIHRPQPGEIERWRELAKGAHGWVIPRPDGTKAACGGPIVCRECQLEEMVYNARQHVSIMEGFRIAPGDKVLLIAPPNSGPGEVKDMFDLIVQNFPEVHFTVVSGFTGVQVHKAEPTE